MLSALTIAIRTIAIRRRRGEWRQRGCGDAATSPSNTSASRLGSSQNGPIVSLLASARSSRIAAAATSCAPQYGSRLSTSSRIRSASDRGPTCALMLWMVSRVGDKLREGGSGSTTRNSDRCAHARFCPPLAILVALAIAACGGSSSTTSSAPAQSSSTTATASRARAPPRRRSRPDRHDRRDQPPRLRSRARARAAAASPCRASGLALSYLGGQGATGHGLLGFALRNTRSTSCNTIGYPGIQFLGKSGEPLPTHPIHTTKDFFGHTKLAEGHRRPG